MEHKIAERTALPESFAKYFWDCNFNELVMEEYHQFIVERILNFGDDAALQWLLQHTDKNTIKNIVKNSRKLTPKTKKFWQIMSDRLFVNQEL